MKKLQFLTKKKLSEYSFDNIFEIVLLNNLFFWLLMDQKINHFTMPREFNNSIFEEFEFFKQRAFK